MSLVPEKRNFSVIAGLFFLFPLGMGSVRHYSSTLFVLMILTGIWSLFRSRGKLPTSHVQIILAFLGFICMISLSLLNAVDVAEGFHQLGKMAYFTALIPLYIATRNVSVSLVNSFMWGLVFAGPINISIALYYLHNPHISRARGFYNPIIFGDLTILCAMLLIVCILSGRLKGWLALTLGSLSVFSFLLSCYLSGTRGAWVVIPVVLTVLFFLFKNRLNKKYLLFAGSVIVLACLLVLSISAPTQSNRNIRAHTFSETIENFVHFSQGEKLNTSLGQRLMMWEISVQMVKEKPLLGFGLGGFRGEVERLIKEKKTTLNIAHSHAHSIYLQTLATTGILGFLSMLLGLFVVPGIVFYRALSGSEEQRLAARGGLIFLLCFAVFGLTEYWLARSPMRISYILCLLIFSVGCTKRKPA